MLWACMRRGEYEQYSLLYATCAENSHRGDKCT